MHVAAFTVPQSRGRLAIGIEPKFGMLQLSVHLIHTEGIEAQA
jgi:hypothetical protein